jgi:two-component system CheB/CheR fusion protein
MFCFNIPSKTKNISMKSQKKSPAKGLETKKVISNKTIKSKSDQFPIVGIGASAGGLEALELFFENMPADSGMAFVVIQHLAPDYKGIMPELLQRITKMKVVTVTDGLKIKPNYLYIIPPNTSMSILNGSLYLFKPIEIHGLRLPIDFFFRSLAEDQKEHSIAIILSGMGSDGSLGLKSIKEKGGMVLVQNPETAKFDSMPLSATKAVIADVVALPSELPERLLTITQSTYNKSVIQDEGNDISSLEKIIILLRTQTGNDFSQYKKNTLYRRIERRMGIHKIKKTASYVVYLQENPIEIEILFNELLIGVTNFFRDASVWEYLKNKVFPTIFARLQEGHILRAWVPACSTGEEAYTLAIVFKEAIEKTKTNKKFTLQIFATDLDSGSIDIARKGIYPSNIISKVSKKRLSRFFVKNEDDYRLNAEIREMVVFAPHSVIKDPPFTKLDIVSCRNMLIYMNSDLQKKILSLFHYSLNQKGILILGSAETNNNMKNFFNTVDSKLRIYQSTGVLKKEELFNFPSAFSKSKMNTIVKQTMPKATDNIQALTDDLLLQQFSPASVLATSLGDILYLTGNTGKYLTPAAGRANMNIFSMARAGLVNELSLAFRKVIRNYEKLILHNIKIETNGETLIVNVTIQQVEKPEELRGKIMVIFNDVSIDKQKTTTHKKTKSTTSSLQTEFEKEIQRLNAELKTANEEMQTSQEEQKSTNEELQSSNEELQSANEELTTSKEEMQSLNEELHTVNVELQSKINDSHRVTNDMNNLLNSSQIATLFLDKSFKIRQFTIHATKIFKLIKSDIGRPFTDLANNLIYSELKNDVKEVLRTLVFIEKTISTNNGLYYTIRIMPYRTLDDKIEGLVITFIDVTKEKHIEIALLETQNILNSFISKVPSVIIGLSSKGQIIEFNKEAEKVFGRIRNEVLGGNYFDLFISKSLRKKVESEMKQILSGNLPNQFENIVKSASGHKLKIEWTAHKMFNGEGNLTGVIAIGENIISL